MALKHIFSPATKRLNLKLITTILLAFLGLTTQAQQRFTYGVATSLGRSTLTSNVVGHRSGYISFEFGQPVTSHWSVQAGGYARYYPTSWLFIQSGAYYQYDYGSFPLVIETQQLRPGGDFRNDVEHLLVDYRFHQVEVPVLLGVRVLQRLRVYAGPSGGFSLATRTTTATSANYQYRNDPVFRNVRVGVGADWQRFTLDVFLQQTWRNDSYFSANKSLSDPVVENSETAIRYDNFNLRRVMITLGYRLH